MICYTPGADQNSLRVAQSDSFCAGYLFTILARIMHNFSTASPKSLVLTVLRSVGLPSVSLHRYSGVRGERDGVKFAKRQRHDVDVHRGGGATKKLMPSRRHLSGWWGLRATSVSLVAADVPASPSPCSLISPRKPHQRTLPYLWNEALNVPYSTLAGSRSRALSGRRFQRFVTRTYA